MRKLHSMKIYKEKIGNKHIIHIGKIKIIYKKHVNKNSLKQDKKSQIEFYLIDSFEIYHYLLIYKELINRGINARIVAEPCEINTSKTWFDYDTAIKILEDKGVDYCTKANPNAKIAITTQRAELLSKYKNKKINLSYGFGWTNNYFINSLDAIKDFDFKFVHGEIQEKILNDYKTNSIVKIFGYPKYNDFLKNPPEKETILKELNINTNKPILGYFPTWDEDASISKFADEINKLREHFFVITKPHHCTLRLPNKKDDLQTIFKISDLVLDGNYDFAKAAYLCDIALCDAKSGASCEVPYLNNNKPLILLSNTEDLSKYLPSLIEYSKIITKPSLLVEEVKSIFKDDIFKDTRKIILEKIYSKKDTYKVVTTIKEILEN